MAKLAISRPFEKGHLDEDLRAHPVGAKARQPLRPGERRRRDLERVQPRPEVEQQSRIETGADLSGKDETGSLADTDEQRAEPHARPLRTGEPAAGERLRGTRLRLQPGLRS